MILIDAYRQIVLYPNHVLRSDVSTLLLLDHVQQHLSLFVGIYGLYRFQLLQLSKDFENNLIFSKVKNRS